MFGAVRIAVRFFFIGLVAGVLLAPREGAQTRAMLRERFESLVNQLLEVAALPPIQMSGRRDGPASEGARGGAASSQRRGSRARAAGRSDAGASE